MTSPTQYPNLVGGRWRESISGRWMDVHDPADRTVIVGRVPAMTETDVREVYACAADGAQAWGAHSSVERGGALLRTAGLVRERRDAIARDLTLEMGKTIAEARAEVDKSADFFEYYGGLGRADRGAVLATEPRGTMAWTVREPLGVVLTITPWNDPLLTPARKAAPALIAGNAVILKPASLTPVVANQLARCLSDAGLPAGTFSTITGPVGAIADALVDDEALSAISFTGSNEIGEALRMRVASRNIPFLGELGGKNATVVLADADLDAAAQTISSAAFAQAGQRCTATSRVIVESPVSSALLDRLAGLSSDLVLGPGLDPATTMGPVASDERRDVVVGFVERACTAGARVVAGGSAATNGACQVGSYVEPTILAEVAPEMECWQEEIFGPVIAVTQVSGLRQAIAQVNSTRYGLAAAVFTRDLTAAHEFIRGAKVGQVAVNLPTSGWDVQLPFGGFRASGSGHKEQGMEALAFYTRTKTINLAT